MDATGILVEVLKGEGPRVLATLARTIGDLAVAEDALSEATITALDAWPSTGIPDNPRAWLAVVARRKALDLLRRESARAAKEAAETSLRDDMLRLIFTCCHPALGREAQVALSLPRWPGSRCRPSPAPSWCLRPPWPSAWCGPAPRSPRPASPT